jgi:leader peptidase (prepilin peptidase)/N-methyltransferase
MSLGPATVAGAVLVAAACISVSPYLAGLTRTVPDRDDRRWWRPTRVGRARRVATALVGAVLGALAGGASGWGVALPAFAALALVATPLVVIDYEHHRLPDRLVGPLGAAAALLFTVAAIVDSDWPALGRAAAAAGVEFAALLALNLASPRSFGLGDVKLGAVLGAYLGWFGWPYLLWGIVAGFVLGAVVSLALVVARRATVRTAVPFGPALLVGALLATILGRW